MLEAYAATSEIAITTSRPAAVHLRLSRPLAGSHIKSPTKQTAKVVRKVPIAVAAQAGAGMRGSARNAAAARSAASMPILARGVSNADA